MTEQKPHQTVGKKNFVTITFNDGEERVHEIHSNALAVRVASLWDSFSDVTETSIETVPISEERTEAIK